MTYENPRDEIAVMMTQTMRLRAKFFGERHKYGWMSDKEESECKISKEDGEAIELSTLQEEWFMETVATNPRWWDELEPWMIDIGGHAEPIEEEIKGLIENVGDGGAEAFHKKIVELGGSLAKHVSEAIKAWGFKISDSSGGCGGGSGWEIGILCNDTDAKRLCSLMYCEFGSLIEKEELRIKRHFWGFHFPEVYNTPMAEEWIKKRASMAEEWVKKRGLVVEDED